MSDTLNRDDFKRIQLDQFHYYYSCRMLDFEICLEPCAAGFDVAMYCVIDQELVAPKQCTEVDGYLDSPWAMFGERAADAWNKALAMSNELFWKRFPSCRPKVKQE